MSEQAKRELTLEEWVNGLPEGHRARVELTALKRENRVFRQEFSLLGMSNSEIDTLLTAEEQASVLRRPYTQLAGTRKPMIGGTEITAEEQEDA